MRKVALVLTMAFSPALAWAEERLSLEQFLAEVGHENLEVKSEALVLESAQSGARGIALPAPMIGVSQIQDQSGKAQGLEISQTIPFPSKLSEDHSARQFEAETQKVQSLLKTKEVLVEARQSFISLWLSQERLQLLEEKKAAIQDHLRLATAGARSDSFLKIHLLKTESDLDLLDNEILSMKQTLNEKQIQMAQLLGRSSPDFKAQALEPRLSEVPEVRQLTSPLQVESKRLRLENLRSLESEAKSGWLPDFNLRYREMSGTSMNPRYTELMVGATLPFLFFWEPSAATAKARAERHLGEVQLQQESQKVESRKALLLTRAQSLRKQLTQVTERLLPRAEKRMHLVHNLAPRDAETLQDHRETLEAFPDLKLRALELREQYEETISELLKYSSEEIK